ncbi:MAG: FeoA family protein [Sulfolobales archaeon]|nr:ferrous iron transport protein A [Sulfolobales archaeon]MCX8208616.1 ferrous iron transport protein A [Sulfolobales archaeon]MDW8010872.1 FeoA family protein [Sulfolobales archaeon]
MVPLSEVSSGTQVRVVKIEASNSLKSRLEQLGLFPGSLAEVLANSNGHVLVRVYGSIVSLSRGVASNILVEEL